MHHFSLSPSPLPTSPSSISLPFCLLLHPPITLQSCLSLPSSLLHPSEIQLALKMLPSLATNNLYSYLEMESPEIHPTGRFLLH